MKSEQSEFELDGTRFSSRLIMGTGKFSERATMIESIKASETELVTVALRRFSQDAVDDLLGPLMTIDNLTLMPNTSGARDAREAIKAAILGRELSESKFVKVEIHPNPHHLMPDPIETYEACGELVKQGFAVMPYIPADPVLSKRLEEMGCASVMPLGSAIGSGQGIQTRAMVELIIRDSNIPVIVDAGIRSPGEAALALEMGCDAVLVNSAVAAAADPPAMARAFSKAVKAGFEGRNAGIMSGCLSAIASSPLTSFVSKT